MRYFTASFFTLHVVFLGVVLYETCLLPVNADNMMHAVVVLLISIAFGVGSIASHVLER